MRQINLDSNFKAVGAGINLMKELENAPQRHYGNYETQMQPQAYNEVDFRSRRNAAKMAQLLQQQNYQQADPYSKLTLNKQQQQSIERLNAQNQDLNSSSNYSKNTSTNFMIPVIKDLNQERMIQRMKSRTIHSEQSSPKMDKNTPSNINSEFSGYQANFTKEFSPKLTDQNNSQNSIGFNQLSSMVYNQCSVARSQSKEKELVQSTNLNSLESEWSKIKREHNFDHRSQSPFRFHTPAMHGSQIVSYQHQNSNLGNESKISNHSNIGGGASSSLSRSNAEYQMNYRGDVQSSLERSVDSTKKPFENNNSSVTISSKIHKNTVVGEQKSKQKTLIKKSVPLSKINLELVKQEQLSGRQLTAGRKTPKSTSSQSTSKQSQIIISGATPTHGQIQSQQSSSSLSNRQHRNSQEGKEESHFQSILDKYQNVHKRQTIQQYPQSTNLNNSNLSNNSSSSFQQNNYQCISTQPLHILSALNQEQSNLSNYEMSGCTGAAGGENKRNSVYDSQQFNFKIQKEDQPGNRGGSPPPISQQIYSFSSKVINPSNYHTSPGFSHNTTQNQQQMSIGANKNVSLSSTSNPPPNMSSQLSSLQNIPYPQSNYISSVGDNQNLNGSQLSGIEKQYSAELTSSQLQSSSSSKIHNQIKIMSPKQNDLKSISQRNILNKQNSSENVQQYQYQSQTPSETSSQFNHLSKGGIEDVELTTSKYYGKVLSNQNHQERDVKQLIMNKIHKMNVAKICLKDEEIGTINSSSGLLNNSDNLLNNGQNTFERGESEVNRSTGGQQHNLISYSPISNHNDRHQLRSNSPHQQNNLSSSSCSLQINKPFSQMPAIKYQPQSESKKMTDKAAINSNTTSPERLDNQFKNNPTNPMITKQPISKNITMGAVDYKLKQINQSSSQQQFVQQGTNSMGNNSNNQIYPTILNQVHQQQQTQNNHYSSTNIAPKNISGQQLPIQSINPIQSSNKYQINLAQILQGNEGNKQKDYSSVNQENNLNYMKKDSTTTTPQSQYLFSSSTSTNCIPQANTSSIQTNQPQQTYYQRINPLQVSTNINRVAHQKVPDQTKITTIKPAQNNNSNNDQFTYFSKPQILPTQFKNFVLQPQLDNKSTTSIKNPPFIPQQQMQENVIIQNGVDRNINRSNSTEGQFQLGQLQNGLLQQKQQPITNDFNQNWQRQAGEQNNNNNMLCGTNSNRTGNNKPELQNQHTSNNNVISYQNNISLSYKPAMVSHNNQQYSHNNHIDRLNNGFIQPQQSENNYGKSSMIQQYKPSEQQTQYGSINSNQKVYEQNIKRSFLTNGGQSNNMESSKIKKAGSFFAQ